MSYLSHHLHWNQMACFEAAMTLKQVAKGFKQLDKECSHSKGYLRQWSSKWAFQNRFRIKHTHQSMFVFSHHLGSSFLQSYKETSQLTTTTRDCLQQLSNLLLVLDPEICPSKSLHPSYHWGTLWWIKIAGKSASIWWWMDFRPLNTVNSREIRRGFQK